MDLKQLRTFMHVTELGSLTLAAQRLHIAQPALSRQIRQLEEELGVMLFDRDGRGMQLSKAGTLLRDRIAPLLREFERTRAEITGLASRTGGHITVGMPPTLSEACGAALISHHIRNHPEISLSIVTGLSGHLFDWLLRNELDVAFLYDPPSVETLAIEPLGTEELWLVGTNRAGFPHEETVPFSTLASLPLVLPGTKHGLRRMLEASAQAKGAQLDVRVEVDSHRVQLELVCTEEFYTVMPDMLVQFGYEPGRFSRWRVVDPTPRRDLVLAAATTAPASQVRRDFIASATDFLRRHRRQAGIEAKRL